MSQMIKTLNPRRLRARARWIRRGSAAAATAAIVIAASGFGDSTVPSRLSVVHWAVCLRAHGIPTFPDPDRNGAINSGRFDPASAAFASASHSCLPVQPAGAITAVPGRP
jgi:hypothetical protein